MLFIYLPFKVENELKINNNKSIISLVRKLNHMPIVQDALERSATDHVATIYPFGHQENEEL